MEKFEEEKMGVIEVPTEERDRLLKDLEIKWHIILDTFNSDEIFNMYEEFKTRVRDSLPEEYKQKCEMWHFYIGGTVPREQRAEMFFDFPGKNSVVDQIKKLYEAAVNSYHEK